MFYSGVLYAIGASMFWGVTYVLMDRLMTNISPLQFLFLTSTLFLLIIAPFILLQSPTSREFFAYIRANGWMLLFAVVCTILANLLILQSIKLLGASTASALEIMYPFFVALFTAIFFGAHFTPVFFLGSFFIFTGSFLIIWFQ